MTIQPRWRRSTKPLTYHNAAAKHPSHSVLWIIILCILPNQKNCNSLKTLQRYNSKAIEQNATSTQRYETPHQFKICVLFVLLFFFQFSSWSIHLILTMLCFVFPHLSSRMALLKTTLMCASSMLCHHQSNNPASLFYKTVMNLYIITTTNQ